MSFAVCNTNPDTAESRKAIVRSPTASVGTTSHLNTLQSSQDGGLISKQPSTIQQFQQQSQSATQQQQQQPTVQNVSPQTYTRISSDYSAVTHPHSAVYTQGQPTTPSGGYFISVNQQGGQATATLSPGEI